MKLHNRKAIAMIELIFSIVVIGIVMLSVPLLLTQAQKSTTVALQQESIAIAASHTNALLTYAWDEQNTEGLGATTNILRTQSTNLAQVTGSRFMNDTLTFPNARRRVYSNADASLSAEATSITELGEDNASENSDDVDDFHNKDFSLNLVSGSSNASYKGEYIDTEITVSNRVVYGDDTAGYSNTSGVFAFSQPFRRTASASSTNIKLITTTLTTTRTEEEFKDKKIVFNVFMCNVGSFQPSTRGGI